MEKQTGGEYEYKISKHYIDLSQLQDKILKLQLSSLYGEIQVLDMIVDSVSKEDSLGLYGMKVDAKCLRVFQWKNHANLHGWFVKRFNEKSGQKYHKGNMLISEEDLDDLYVDILIGNLPDMCDVYGPLWHSTGTAEERSKDAQFIKIAKRHIKKGRVLYYEAITPNNLY